MNIRSLAELPPLPQNEEGPKGCTSERRGRQSMIVLWILLGLLALIFLLLCIPCTFDREL
jgi:hypothetical protein